MLKVAKEQSQAQRMGRSDKHLEYVELAPESLEAFILVLYNFFSLFLSGVFSGFYFVIILTPGALWVVFPRYYLYSFIFNYFFFTLCISDTR